MRSKIKIFRVIIFSLITAPFLFFGFSLVKSEIKSKLFYGEKVISEVIEKKVSNGDNNHGYYMNFIIKSKYKKKEYQTTMLLRSGGIKNKNIQKLFNEIKIEDKLEIKILNEFNAKILKWKGLIISEDKFNYGRLLRILIINLLGVLGIYMIFITLKTKINE